eukprot:XP_001707465.1 Hypothetical protein GL50803_37321 [Giardia lamblia ATCC 50803]
MHEGHVPVDVRELVPDKLEAVEEVVGQELVDPLKLVIVLVEPVLRLDRIGKACGGDGQDSRVQGIAYGHVDHVELRSDAACVSALVDFVLEFLVVVVIGQKLRLEVLDGRLEFRYLEVELLVVPLQILDLGLVLQGPLAQITRLVRDTALRELLEVLDLQIAAPDLVIAADVLAKSVVLVSVFVLALQLAVEPHRLLVDRGRHEICPGHAAVGRKLLVVPASQRAPDHLIEVLDLLEEGLLAEVILGDGVPYADLALQCVRDEIVIPGFLLLELPRLLGLLLLLLLLEQRLLVRHR